jgi:hypothetical protein
MQTIRARMTYLRNGEAFAAVALPVVFSMVWEASDDPVAWAMRSAAMATVVYILLQGMLYWQLKLRSTVLRQPLPAYFQPLYRFFKYSNVVAIAGVAMFIALAGGGSADLWWSCGLLAFAVLEHINYYHYQLMYDTRGAFDYVRRNGRLRRAALGLDLRRHNAL